MKLAVSDTGFDQLQDVASHLTSSVEYLEIVPTKIKPFKDLTIFDLLTYRSSLVNIGLAPYSLLSLFYTLDIPDVSHTEDIYNHLVKLNHYMVDLNCELMVYGSPTMRKAIPQWEDHLVNIFNRLDKELNQTGKYLIIEPVASSYGAEFFTTIDDIVKFLDKHQYSNIYTMIDTHNLFLENQDPVEKYLEYKNYIKHIHVAEIGLGELKNKPFHKKFAKTLQNYEYVVTHEIRDRDNFTKSLKTFEEIYG
jgi:sugar phosphate isomerase/epimerase